MISILMVIALLSPVAGFTCTGMTGNNFLPKNGINIPANLKSNTGISQIQFNKVIDRLLKIYTPIISQLNAKFVINGRWEFASANAFAFRYDDKYGVEIAGGLARHPLMTEDAFALAVCHEIGHLIGGIPKNKKPILEIYSNEGQADYFATLKCLRVYFAKDNNSLINSRSAVPESLKNSCIKIYRNQKARDLCIRIGLASLDAGRFHAAVNKTANPSFDTPDLNIVKDTFDDHPKAQCRLDTYLQGALCARSVNEKLSDEDEVSGACHTLRGDSIGLRPTCWFKSKSE